MATHACVPKRLPARSRSGEGRHCGVQARTMKIREPIPSPSTGEGEGGGGHEMVPPTLILPRKGGGDKVFDVIL